MLKLFVDYVLPTLLTVGLPALLGLGVKALNTWVAAYAAKHDHNKGALLLQELTFFAGSVVTEVELTLRPFIKSALVDGKITQEEAAGLKDQAMTKLKSILGESGQQEIQKVLGIFDVDAFLSGILENAVASTKPAPAPVAVVTSP